MPVLGTKYCVWQVWLTIILLWDSLSLLQSVVHHSWAKVASCDCHWNETLIISSCQCWGVFLTECDEFPFIWIRRLTSCLQWLQSLLSQDALHRVIFQNLSFLLIPNISPVSPDNLSPLKLQYGLNCSARICWTSLPGPGYLRPADNNRVKNKLLGPNPFLVDLD